MLSITSPAQVHCRFLIANCRLNATQPSAATSSKSLGLAPIGNQQSEMIWWLRVELNHQPRAYETLALFHLSYTAVFSFSFKL
jgi:hypothetical protein